MWRNLVLCPSQGICRWADGQLNNQAEVCGVTDPGRYIILRSVTKSLAVSVDRIRGQPLGDSAVAKFV